MILAVAATEIEMAPFLAQSTELGELALVCRTLVTGVGPVETVLRLTRFLCESQEQFDTVIHFGVGGAYILPDKSRQPTLLDICLAEQARVALGDEVAQLINARHLILLVGERPGLSSPNSLGIYYTYAAKAGYTDAKRNCISNVRSGGQSVPAATKRLMWLVREAEVRKLSGVQLKDESDSDALTLDHQQKNILLP